MIIAIFSIAILTPCYTNVVYFSNTTDQNISIDLFENEISEGSHIKRFSLPPRTEWKKIRIRLESETALCVSIDGRYEPNVCHGYMEPFYDFGKEHFMINEAGFDYVLVTESDDNYIGLIGLIFGTLYRGLSCAL